MRKFITSICLALSLQAQAVEPLHIIQFKQGWPDRGVTISNLPMIYSIKSSGHYSWAIGLQTNGKMGVSFFDGNHWTEGVSIADMVGISKISPLYQDGIAPQALAFGINKVSYFDGRHWFPATTIKELTAVNLMTSMGHAFAISTKEPIQSSFFDNVQNSWSEPVNLADKISMIRSSSAAAGHVYLLGFDKNGNATLLSSSDNERWYSHGFEVNRPQNLQVIAEDDSVFVVLIKESNTFFYYSKDKGATWETTPWPEGLILATIHQGQLWMYNEQQIGYLDSTQKHPIWHMMDIPPSFGRVKFFSNPSLDGTELCMEANGPMIACYNQKKNGWTAIPETHAFARRLDRLMLLDPQQLVAIGEDTNQKAGLFYYDGITWHVSHSNGLLAGVNDLYFSGTNLWATGHN